MSNEADSCRKVLSPYCKGNGLDIGTNGYPPIVPNAITVDKYPSGNGNFPVQLVWDAFESLPFRDGTLDFVFSSHCLEDALRPFDVFCEWKRVVKRGGHIVLFLPDEQRYRAHCKAAGALPNQAHRHADFSLVWIKRECLEPDCKVVFESDPFPNNHYSFAIVIQKL